MSISSFAVNNRTTVFVLVAVIIIVGLSAYNSLPREDEPDVKIPFVFISTTYKGVAPKDIETSITIPIEKKLKGLKNVKDIKSTSSEGVSSIAVEFVTGTEIETAKQWVKDKVDMAKRELPTDLEDDPSVFEVNLSEMPIFTLAVTGKQGLRELKEIAKDLKEDIETIPGVLEVDLVGGLDREIHVEVDPDLLAIYGLPISALTAKVRNENQNVSGGNISMGDGRYQLRVPGEFKNISDFENLMITKVNGSPVYLRDIAEVKDSYREKTSTSKFNSRKAINLYIKKRSGENIIYIVDAVKELIKNKKSVLPDGIRIIELMDKSRNIRFMISDLENNIITGIILVILVLMFAMGLRNAVLVGIAIPMSMLLSFAAIQFMDITLNMVTLFSLTLALGMLVDNAIVIVENIYRFTSQGVPKARAAILASKEVAVPVAASTATTVVAFYPLLYWTGIMGEFMKYLPITLITTLLSSLFVALVVNPAFCSVFIKVGKESENMTEEEILAAGEKPIQDSGIIIRTYEYVLRKSLDGRISVIITSVLVLVLFLNMWLLRTGVEKAVEFMPSIDPESCYINIDAPEGMDLKELEKIGEEVEKRIKNFNNIPEQFRMEEGKPAVISEKMKKRFEKFKKDEGIQKEEQISDLRNIRFLYSKYSTKSGGASSFSMGGNSSPNHIGVQFHDFEGRVESSQKTMKRIRARLKGITGANIFISEAKHGPPTGAPINIEISGDDFNVLSKIAGKVKSVVRQIPHTKDVEDDYVKGTPTLELEIDRNRAAFFGLSTGEIGSIIKTAINGMNVSTYREGDEDYDIVIKAGKEYRHDINILKKLYIPTQSMGLVPVSDVVNIKYTGGLGVIKRINHERVITVKAEVNADKMPGAVAKSIAEKFLSNQELPAGYSMKFTGEDEFQKESEEFLGRAFITALILVFLVLVLQFNSVMHTVIIMFSVILSFGGIFLGLFVVDMPFGVIMTGIGLISLAGVVVNNAIVLLDYINQLIERGYGLTDAVVEASKTRFRPVLLTAITTILGLFPMITGMSYDFKKFEIIYASFSSQFWFSMAIAVAFGLTIATILTLIVVPVVFHFLTDIKERIIKYFSKTKKFSKLEKEIKSGLKIKVAEK